MNSMKANPRTKSGGCAAKVEGESRSPILHNEVDRPDPRLRDERVEIAHMILEAIGRYLACPMAEANEIRGDAMRDLRDEEDDVAPEIGGGRIAVQEQRDRCVRPARLAVGHLRIEDGKLRQADVWVSDLWIHVDISVQVDISLDTDE
jgi:hypothetical protein